MANPNDCSMCDHKKHPDGGWCYMFKNEPVQACLQHTIRRGKSVTEVLGELRARQRRSVQFQIHPDNP